MTDWQISFDAPWLLALTGVLPLFWWIGRRSLRQQGTWRRSTAVGLRVLIAALIIGALAEPNWVAIGQRIAVLFLFDGSASIDRDEREQALQLVNAAASRRQAERGDRAGVIQFGQNAATEIPPVDDDWQLDRFETTIAPDFTDLSSAMRLAAASFPPDAARRVVLVTDGNENLGDALGEAERLWKDGVGIDVAPIRYRRLQEVSVDKVLAPPEASRGVPFDVRVVVSSAEPGTPVRGTLRLVRIAGDDRHLVSEQPVVVDSAKRVFSVRQKLEESGFFTYEATFVPDEAAGDRVANNQATAFSHVRGRGQVLLIEDAEQPGRFDRFASLLRRHEMEVTVRPSSQPFGDLADLQQFDAVLLADVPRVSGDGAEALTNFSNEQIETLVRNTQQLGCGLVVLGGPNSFGAGGWTNTPLEEALPVSFEVQNSKIQAVGALVLVIDSSGSMEGQKIIMSKAAARASAKMLGRMDYIGVVAFDSTARWVAPLQRNDVPGAIDRRIASLAAGGGTDMMPGMLEGFRELRQVQASVKHMVVLTDGQTAPGDFAGLVRRMRAEGITVSGVAVGNDADRNLLSSIAGEGGGKFYQVSRPQAIPRIFMRETRRVTRPVVFEDEAGFAPHVAYPHEVLSGIDGQLPPITGYVLTTVKPNPLVEIGLATNRHSQPNNTILATWQYGLGRTAVLTTDVGQRWATAWTDWPNYEKLLTQLVRWSMRPSGNQGQFHLAADLRDHLIRVTVTGLDEDKSYLNSVQMAGAIVGPTGEPSRFALTQTAPGRYLGEFPANTPGNYYVAVQPGARGTPLRTAINVPQSAEFDRTISNDLLLEQLASGVPTGGQPGRLLEPEAAIQPGEVGEPEPPLLSADVFRHDLAPAKHYQAIWPFVLLVAGCLFFSDVFCRRVQISFDWWPKLSNGWRSRAMAEPSETAIRLDRLKRQKQAAISLTDSEMAKASDKHFVAESSGEEASQAKQAIESPATSPVLGHDESAALLLSYTERLLRAKRRPNN